MENELFSWEGFDVVDTMSLYFYDCVLKVAIGDYAEGTVISGIAISYEEGVMEFYNNNDGDTVIAKFKLSLKVEALS